MDLMEFEMTGAYFPKVAVDKLITHIHEKHNTLHCIYMRVGPAYMAPLRAININMDPQVEAELAFAYVTLQSYTNLAKIFPVLVDKMSPVFDEMLMLCRELREKQLTAQ